MQATIQTQKKKLCLDDDEPDFDDECDTDSEGTDDDDSDSEEGEAIIDDKNLTGRSKDSTSAKTHGTKSCE